LSKVPTGRCADAARGDELAGLIKKILEIGIYATRNEFDAQRVRTQNAGLLMITAVRPMMRKLIIPKSSKTQKEKRG
jgi:hypothetical protein